MVAQGIKQTIFDGRDYIVCAIRHGREASESGPVIVTFPHAGRPAATGGIGFAESFLKSKKIDACFVLNKKTDWFQSPELFTALQAVRDHVGQRDIVTYGSCMGGYGALLSSGALAARRVLAVVPQYSIARDVVPFERRWKTAAHEIGDFIHDIEREIHPQAQVTLLLDPRNDDRKQAALFPALADWNVVNMPFAGHMPLIVMQEGGVLSRFILAVLLGDQVALPSTTEILQSRRTSPLYYRTLGIHAARLGRMRIAEDAALFCEILEKRPYAEKVREVIDKMTMVRQRTGRRILV